jgi:hypothetical protein
MATPPSTAIIESLAVIRETDPLEMEPLFPAIDLDAVDTLLTRGPETGLQLTFSVARFCLTLTAGGLVRIQPQREVAEG